MKSEDIKNRTLQKLQQLDNIYRNSPSAQVLLGHAPIILQYFKEMNMMSIQYQAQIETLAVNRDSDLQKFRMVAPQLLEQCNILLNNVLNLQHGVRELASRVSGNPDASTVISYTNQQIDKNIALYNNLIYNILNV